MPAAAIHLENLVFRWRPELPPAVELPRLTVDAGKSLFLHGPSGAGKSTLLNLIGGVVLPERGELVVLGQSLAALSAARRDAFRADHFGFIFQQFNLLPWLSVLENIVLPCRFSSRRKARSGEPLAEAQRLLTALDLDAGNWQKKAGELSVGQQQRVAAARALIGRPEILIADEPTSALDTARQDAFIDLLLSEARAVGSTVVFVSHDHRLAGHFDQKFALTAGAVA